MGSGGPGQDGPGDASPAGPGASAPLSAGGPLPAPFASRAADLNMKHAGAKYPFLRSAADKSSTSTLCESAFTANERTRFETRPEGKAPTLAPTVPSRGAGRGLGAAAARGPGGAQSPSRRASRAGAVAIAVRSCAGAGEGFQGSLLLDLAGKPGGKFLAAKGRCGREPGTAGRRARRSLTPPQRFRAGQLLILPPFPITDVRQYQIRSAISYPASAPMPAAQRVNSFSLKPTPPKRTPTKTKLNKTPTKPSLAKTITRYSLDRLSPLPRTVEEISLYACIETCWEPPHVAVSLLLCPGNKIK
ncbi:spidroin-2-like [Prinia subflava]|uniref:spidroin-2-like n=1 Tax=Prinia subflava TaxID=208062 RepID=UPI002FE38EAC